MEGACTCPLVAPFLRMEAEQDQAESVTFVCQAGAAGNGASDSDNVLL